MPICLKLEINYGPHKIIFLCNMFKDVMTIIKIRPRVFA